MTGRLAEVAHSSRNQARPLLDFLQQPEEPPLIPEIPDTLDNNMALSPARGQGENESTCRLTRGECSILPVDMIPARSLRSPIVGLGLNLVMLSVLHKNRMMRISAKRDLR